ncbi:hypothetical protein AV530_001621 [Patagioenas fasciata monilis]|uniref:Uncharacterized protein n=1 Tax=Patagioenas fasciata monilis TaxID=372326 RepID=A0A1V4K529_PATFA|nr:hypothetical protein AV530_001621 [Patagioenas fasciata monilis]
MRMMLQREQGAHPMETGCSIGSYRQRGRKKRQVCLETFASEHGDTGMDLCNEEAVGVEQSGPRAARTTTIHGALA